MPATTSRHSLWFRVMGATKAAAKNKMVARSIKNIEMAHRQLKAGMLGMRGMMTGAAASLVAIGLALRRVVTDYERYTLAQSRLRTALAATTNQGARNARVFAGPLAESVGRDFGYSLAEANEAMGTMIQTGIGVHRSMRVFRSSMRLARVADMDTANATRFLVDTMNMFRGEMREGDGTLQGFANRMTGQLAVAAYSTSTNIEDLQQAFRYAGTELSGLGYNSREVMSALAGLSVVGLRSTTAGTRLRGAMMAMHRTTGPLTALLQRHGIQSEEVGQAWYNADGSLRPFYEGLENMTGLIRRVGNQQDRNAIQMHLFGRRAFAAGQFVTGMSQAAVRARRAFDQLNSSTRPVEEVLREMEQERMRSFSMQMTQLREGLSDLAIGFGTILFGEMQEGERGFGTYMRQLSEGVMLIGQMNGGNAIAKRRWSELSPDVRRAASELRTTFVDIAGGLRVLGRLLMALGRFVRDHPYITAAIIAIRIAFGGLINPVALAWTGLLRFGTQLRLFPTQAAAASTGAALFRAALGGLAIHGVGLVTRRMQDWTVAWAGGREEMDRIRQSTVAAHSEIARGIPIVGNLVSQYLDLIGAMQQAWRVANEQEERQKSTYEMGIGSTAQQRVTRRVERTQSTRIQAGLTPGQVRLEAARNQESVAIQESATLMHAWGLRTEEDIRARLHHQGIEGARLNQLTESIHRAQQAFTSEEAVVREAQRMSRETWLGTRDLSGSLTDSVVQLRQFGAVLESMSSRVGVGSGVMLRPGMEAPLSPLAEDAYVQRGGVMGVSSGDLIVSRRHLADAITARRGALAGPAVGMSSEGSMAGPQPSTSGGDGDITVTVPVTIDGREVARAVGRANVRQLERGGGDIAPGERRSLRETGFRRNV